MPKPVRPFSLWHLVWMCTAVVVSFFSLWEFVERRYFPDIDPNMARWLYIMRGSLGSLLLSTGAVWLVMRNRANAEAMIRQSEEKYRSVMSDATDGIAIYRQGDGLVEVNPAFARLCGRTVEDCLHTDMLDVIHPKDRSRVHEWLDRCLDETNPAPGHLECAMLRPDGASRLWKMTASRLRFDRATVSIIVIDITEENLQHQKILQQEKLAGIGLLTAGVAHEIGNPLSSLSSVVQILQMETTDTELADKLQVMDTHIHRISKTVRQMMDFARPPQLEWRMADLNQILDRALDLLRYDRRCQKIDIHKRYDPGLPMVRVMAEGLEQVFMNVLLNAVDAMEEGGQLIVSTAPGDGIVRVTVADTGVGMTSEEIQRAFEPFFTTKPVGKGTGLGLAVSYSLIQRHGGSIDLKSEKGQGASVTVVLPV